MKNCNLYIVSRPLCNDPRLVNLVPYCCAETDNRVTTGMGYMGLDCLPVFLEWKFDGVSPSGLEGWGTLP